MSPSCDHNGLWYCQIIGGNGVQPLQHSNLKVSVHAVRLSAACQIYTHGRSGATTALPCLVSLTVAAAGVLVVAASDVEAAVSFFLPLASNLLSCSALRSGWTGSGRYMQRQVSTTHQWDKACNAMQLCTGSLRLVAGHVHCISLALCCDMFVDLHSRKIIINKQVARSSRQQNLGWRALRSAHCSQLIGLM